MNSHLPLVSIIIPAYNAEAFVNETLNSVLAQTYQNIEVLVVDDGSQDRTAEIVQSIAQKDCRVILFRQSNAGVAAARNLAIQKSKGEYIAPIDADDIWYPQKIEKQVQCMLQAEPSVGVIYTWTLGIDEKGHLNGGYINYLLQGEVYQVLLYRNFLGHASVPLIRRSCIEQIGAYNVKLKENNAQGCEDWDLYLRLAERYQFKVVPEFLVGYRQVVGSMSSNCNSMGKSYEIVLEYAQHKHPEIPNYIFRWAKTNFYFYLLGISYVSGNYRNAVFLAYKIIRLDLTALSCFLIYRVFTVSILKLAVKPLTSLIWSDYYSKLQLRKRPNFKQQVLTIFDIEREISIPQIPRQPYDKIMLQRWLRVVQLSQSISS